MKIIGSAAQIAQLFGRLPGALPIVHGLALGCVVAAGAWAPAAMAVPVLSSATNIAVPLTTAGIYINVVTGVSNVSPASVPGWDINPWGSTTSTSALNFFSPTTPTGGAYVVSAAGQVANLAVGSVIGAATPLFGSGAASTTAASMPWSLNTTDYFGFRFIGDDSLLHYGYGSMIVGSTLASRTIGQLWYESVAGNSITIGNVAAVPEPTNVALLLAGGALVAFVQRRRRQASR